MFLLNDEMVKEYMKATPELLTISSFDRESLLPTHYYFRLGQWAHKWDGDVVEQDINLTKHGSTLKLMPGECARIETLEAFGLSEKVLGVIGPCSELTSEYVQLIHSPTIDPGYPARRKEAVLELAVINHSPRQVDLAVGERIGKVVFFDVHDTYPVKPLEDSRIAEVVKGRIRSDEGEG